MIGAITDDALELVIPGVLIQTMRNPPGFQIRAPEIRLLRGLGHDELEMQFLPSTGRMPPGQTGDISTKLPHSNFDCTAYNVAT